MPEFFYRFFVGWVEIVVSPDCRSAVASLLWDCETPFWHEYTDKTGLHFRLYHRDFAAFSTYADECCISYCQYARGGLPVVLHIARRRPALALGMLGCLVWWLWSQGMVWDIQVSGLQNLSEKHIKEVLASYGCGIGDRYGNIDFDQLHTTIRAEQPDIAWLSVYMNGTTAEVQLREKRNSEDVYHTPGTYSNVVATEAGEVLSIRVFEGQAAVVPGQVVLPGELLISGVVPMKEEGQVRTEYAAGEVIARVVRPITVEIPPEKEKKVYTGRSTTKKSVKFFKKTINLFRNTGIPYATCDTIDMMEEVCLFGRYKIPVTICSTAYRETTTVAETLSPEEAVMEAERKLREETDRALGAGEMLSRTMSTGFDADGVYRIRCLLYLEKDIGTTAEFTITEDRTIPSD